MTIERPVLDQLQIEIGRTVKDRLRTGLAGDYRKERHLHTVDTADDPDVTFAFPIEPGGGAAGPSAKVTGCARPSY